MPLLHCESERGSEGAKEFFLVSDLGTHLITAQIGRKSSKGCSGQGRVFGQGLNPFVDNSSIYGQVVYLLTSLSKAFQNVTADVLHWACLAAAAACTRTSLLNLPMDTREACANGTDRLLNPSRTYPPPAGRRS